MASQSSRVAPPRGSLHSRPTLFEHGLLPIPSSMPSVEQLCDMVGKHGGGESKASAGRGAEGSGRLSIATWHKIAKDSFKMDTVSIPPIEKAVPRSPHIVGVHFEKGEAHFKNGERQARQSALLMPFVENPYFSHSVLVDAATDAARWRLRRGTLNSFLKFSSTASSGNKGEVRLRRDMARPTRLISRNLRSTCSSSAHTGQ